jgi:tetratricopeptide (TPR) repeat protein
MRIITIALCPIKGKAMMHWQKLMNKGNSYFNAKQWSRAECYYKSVYTQLEGRWEIDKESESLLMAWICACHNLGTLFEAKGEHERAIGYLVKAYQQAYNTSQNNNASDTLRYLAFNALNMTLRPIILFSKKHPTCENCITQLKRLQLTLDTEMNTIH